MTGANEADSADRADRRPIAILGLGEAGSAIASGLVAAGALVRGFDPAGIVLPGVANCRDDADASTGCRVVVSLTSAREAAGALAAALPAMPRDAIYADLNTASPGQKATLAALAEKAGLGFADIAIMAPVPGSGLRTPMLASGPAAAQFAACFTGLGANVGVLPGPAGTAAARKLVRSVFYKGMSAAVTEAVRAAEAAGCADWLRENIRQELAGSTPATLDRIERGSRQHAVRRSDEMAAAAEMLRELGVPPRIATASELWLRQLATEQAGG